MAAANYNVAASGNGGMSNSTTTTTRLPPNVQVHIHIYETPPKSKGGRKVWKDRARDVEHVVAHGHWDPGNPTAVSDEGVCCQPRFKFQHIKFRSIQTEIEQAVDELSIYWRNTKLAYSGWALDTNQGICSEGDCKKTGDLQVTRSCRHTPKTGENFEAVDEESKIKIQWFL